MNPLPFKSPPQWWSPQLHGFWIWFWKPLRRRLQVKRQRLVEIETRGVENVGRALAEGRSVLITPNHSGHADPLILYKAAERLRTGFYFMAAWQVLARQTGLERLIMRQHGVFSVDREGTDMRAFRQAVDILREGRFPLVVFPEGEVYHLNDAVTPFHEGPAAIALTAAKHSSRPVVVVPCAIKYQYVRDPTDELADLMGRLEERILWRRRDDLGLHQRIYRFAEAALALKELEYLGHAQTGDLPMRIGSLSEAVLAGLERRYGIPSGHGSIPDRVKVLRREAIDRLEHGAEEADRQGARVDLDDIFVVTQLFSYPGDYVAGRPSIERMAETLDKFEEDVFKVATATIRGTRRAVVSFGKAVAAVPGGDRKQAVRDLTDCLERDVQGLLDGIEQPADRVRQRICAAG